MFYNGTMILGIDEVGRGPWAGPLVVGAVVLGGARIDGLTDSKKLSKKRREELESIILEKAVATGLGWVPASEIDEIGLSAALRLATIRAVEAITCAYSEIIIDGTINFLAATGKGKYVQTMPKADLLVPSVGAASIIAKVARDRYMAEQDEVYPGYGFGSHVGYGVAKHRAAIERLGVTPLHRLSFAPLAKYRINTPLPSLQISGKSARRSLAAGPVGGFTPLSRIARHGSAPSAATRATPITQDSVEYETTKKIGDRAETEVANYLVRAGHEVVARNWKTRYCEIDIVSQKDDTLYFTEVKYRKNARHGDGFAAITAKKLNQMKFAAHYYAEAQSAAHLNLRLAAAAVTGEPPEVASWLEIE